MRNKIKVLFVLLIFLISCESGKRSEVAVCVNDSVLVDSANSDSLGVSYRDNSLTVSENPVLSLYLDDIREYDMEILELASKMAQQSNARDIKLDSLNNLRLISLAAVSDGALAEGMSDILKDAVVQKPGFIRQTSNLPGFKDAVNLIYSALTVDFDYSPNPTEFDSIKSLYIETITPQTSEEERSIIDAELGKIYSTAQKRNE